MEKQVIVIVGPTCSGKSGLALSLARKLNSEIISADSRQVYKLLNIGTAKPSISEMNSVKHHLVDFLLPDEPYNAGKFELDAINIIHNIFNKNKMPVVAGGSGLYIKALIDGIIQTADTDEEYRKELLQMKNKKGIDYLYSLLLQKDPEAANSMLPQNWKRVIRALEVFRLTGNSIVKIHKQYKRNLELKFIQIGLSWDRKILYKNIEQRVDDMIKNGLVDEVETILNKGYSENLNSLNTVGYKEIISYLNNHLSFQRAVELIKRNTRRFAKRQITWFKADKRINWYAINSFSEIEKLSNKIIEDYNLL